MKRDVSASPGAHEPDVMGANGEQQSNGLPEDSEDDDDEDPDDNLLSTSADGPSMVARAAGMGHSVAALIKDPLVFVAPRHPQTLMSKIPYEPLPSAPQPQVRALDTIANR